MTTSEERLQILRMIEEGKITAEDGAKLLVALNAGKRPGPEAGGLRSGEPRWFRVRITDTATGRPKVNVNIPMGLVNVGLKMGARFAPDVEGLDMNQVLEAIRAGKLGKIVDISDEEDGERVEIFVE